MVGFAPVSLPPLDLYVPCSSLSLDMASSACFFPASVAWLKGGEDGTASTEGERRVRHDWVVKAKDERDSEGGEREGEEGMPVSH